MSLRDHLGVVYSDADADAIVDRIGALVASYQKRLPRQVNRKLTQQDVLLITYGDTIRCEGREHLKVLAEFHGRHLQELFSLVHVLPFHPYSSDAGFSVIDYYAVREDLGDWEDVESLARQCGLMVDAVVNHMSSKSPWFEAFLDGDPEFDNFFFECDPSADLSDVVRPRTSPLLTRFADAAGEDRHVWTTFSADQVDLDYRNPEVLLAVIEVLFYFVSRGARLLRLDAVTYLWKEPGTPSANMRQTHALIKVFRSVVSALSRDVVIITETNVPHRENVAYFGDGHDEAHAVYNFALPPLVAHSFIQGDGTRLSQWAKQLSLPGYDVCFLNFTASHDGIGVRPVEEILDADELAALASAALAAGGRVSSRAAAGGSKPYELNCTFLDLLSRPGEDPDLLLRRFVASQAIVLAMPGVPAIYLHSLLGTRNDLQLLRRTDHARDINRSRLELDDVEKNLGDENSLSARIFGELARLIRARQGQPAFDPFAGFEVLDHGPAVFALRRFAAGTPRAVTAVINLTSAEAEVSLDISADGTDLLAGNDVKPGRLVLSPYQVCWIDAPHIGAGRNAA